MEFLLKYRKRGANEWGPTLSLPKMPLAKQIDNLEVYTIYEVSMAAKNQQGPGPWTLKTGITGESGERNTNLVHGYQGAIPGRKYRRLKDLANPERVLF